MFHKNNMEWGHKMKRSKDEKQGFEHNRKLFSNPLFASEPEFAFIGNKEVAIEGSKGVLEYSPELIRVNTSCGIVCFYGRSLNLKCISASQLIIDGFITKVEFVV